MERLIYWAIGIIAIIVLSNIDPPFSITCEDKAADLAEESKIIAQKMEDMGCSTRTTSDALYVKCVELHADNQRVIREWNELDCTNDLQTN